MGSVDIRIVLPVFTFVLCCLLSGCSTEATPVEAASINVSDEPPAVVEVGGERRNSLNKSWVISCSSTQIENEKWICEEILPGFVREDIDSYGRFEVTVAPIDLNSDGTDELVIWESSWAGTSGGSLWVLANTKGEYRRIFETEMTWSPIQILKSKSGGWADFSYHVTGGGVDPVFVIVKHDGKSYRDRSKVMQKQPKGGKVIIGKDWQDSVFGPVAQH